MGLLTGGSVATCGASAALALSAVMAFMRPFRREEGSGKKVPMLPGFLVAFVLLVIVNSLGFIPPVVTESFTDLSRWCLVTAIAAPGVKTSVQKLAVVGWRSVILMGAETTFLLLVVLAFIFFGGVGS